MSLRPGSGRAPIRASCAAMYSAASRSPSRAGLASLELRRRQHLDVRARLRRDVGRDLRRAAGDADDSEQQQARAMQ